MDFNCCQKKCLHQWTPASIQELQDLHKRRSKEEGKQYLLSLFKHAKKISHTWIFIINNKELCKKAAIQIFGITDYGFKKYRRLRQNDTLPVHGNIGRISSQNKTSTAVSWLRNFVESHGEQQPNSSFIHLPSYLNKTDLYDDYKNNMIITNDECVSYGQFCSMWKKHMSNVKIPTHTTLGRCTICTSFETRRKQIKTQEELLAFQKDRREHFQSVASEREALNQRKIIAMVIIKHYYY